MRRRHVRLALLYAFPPRPSVLPGFPGFPGAAGPSRSHDLKGEPHTLAEFPGESRPPGVLGLLVRPLPEGVPVPGPAPGAARGGGAEGGGDHPGDRR